MIVVIIKDEVFHSNFSENVKTRAPNLQINVGGVTSPFRALSACLTQVIVASFKMLSGRFSLACLLVKCFFIQTLCCFDVSMEICVTFFLFLQKNCQVICDFFRDVHIVNENGLILYMQLAHRFLLLYFCSCNFVVTKLPFSIQ